MNPYILPTLFSTKQVLTEVWISPFSSPVQNRQWNHGNRTIIIVASTTALDYFAKRLVWDSQIRSGVLASDANYWSTLLSASLIYSTHTPSPSWHCFLGIDSPTPFSSSPALYPVSLVQSSNRGSKWNPFGRKILLLKPQYLFDFSLSENPPCLCLHVRATGKVKELHWSGWSEGMGGAGQAAEKKAVFPFPALYSPETSKCR